jgi:hypothetical protein
MKAGGIVALAVVAAMGVAVATQWPEVQRYLKVRNM